MLAARHLSIPIARPAAEVYAFAARPENLARWASGLGAVSGRDGEWLRAETPGGPIRLRFAPENEFGVLDYWVRPDGAPEVFVPKRVVPNGDGAEVVFTLFRQPEMTDERFATDVAWVERDLATLKAVLERAGS
ncbi:MAG: SRPBCC family protein [Gemmataceae bacterium]